MSNNIFNDDYRKKFMTNADYKTLNDYLKNMQKLSHKGAKYLEIYNKDLVFLLNNDQHTENLDIFIKYDKSKDKELDNQESELCKTEVYINKVNNICAIEFDEFSHIIKNLNNNKNTNGNINRFVDIIVNCDNLFNDKDINRDELLLFIKTITSIIINNKDFLKQTFKYLGDILRKNNFVIQEFIKKYSILRSKNLGKNEYSVIKSKMIKEYLGRYSCQKVYGSKFVEKIILCYKKI
jgi:hypothetical protein